MAARAMWKGVLHLGKEELPVKVYAAVEGHNVHFHLLHDQDLVRVKGRMAHRKTGETIPYEQIGRGVQVDSGRIVVLDKEELEALEPEPSREIEVEPFVPRGALHHQWYDRPYYLGPDGNEAQYFALAEALADSGREGIARWVMRKKQYLGSLIARDGYLMLITLRHSGEVLDTGELSPPEGRALDKKERQLAEQLIDALKDEFDPDEYRDTYRDRVAKLVEAKAKGETLEVEEYEEPEEGESLAGSLEASIQAAGRK